MENFLTKKTVSKIITVFLLLFCACLAFSEVKFEISLGEDVEGKISSLGLSTPVDGRLFLIISDNKEAAPKDCVDVTGVPFWGMTVSSFETGDSVLFSDSNDALSSYPVENFSDIPDGEYYVQAFLSVYTKFERADGHVLYMHSDMGDGQYIWNSTGNAYSIPKKVYIKNSDEKTFKIDLTEVIMPDYGYDENTVFQQGNYRDTEYVKYVKIKSELLSEFWGQPIYLGANVLLPKNYHDGKSTFYPAIYMQGHFPSGRAPYNFSEKNSFGKFWLSESSPNIITITFRDANPYYDTSYSVNSENTGPWGDAIMQELIPFLEKEFRIIPEKWARVLAGGSTGGWEAMAMKLFHPEFFGMTYVWYPDSLDFHYHQLIDIYEDENAYFDDFGWMKTEKPSSRNTHGEILFTTRQENDYEYAIDDSDRSGGQWAIWEAVFSPVGIDGYPKQLWDKTSGIVNREVADYWKDNYDLTHFIENNWSDISAEINGEIHIAVGDMDNYYLNEACYLLKGKLDRLSTQNPI